MFEEHHRKSENVDFSNGVRSILRFYLPLTSLHNLKT